MAEFLIFDLEGKELGKASADDHVFGQEVKEGPVHQAIIWQLAGRRQGTASTKTRGKVRGGGIKPWRQKGTGRARAGSIRSPLWRGGGTTFGPQPRDFSFKLSQKARRRALKVVLSDKAQSGKIKVVDDLKIPTAKTKEMVKVLQNLQLKKKNLVVIDSWNKDIARASRNIPGTKLISVENLNTYDVLACDTLLFTKESLAKVGEVLSKGA